MTGRGGRNDHLWLTDVLGRPSGGVCCRVAASSPASPPSRSGREGVAAEPRWRGARRGRFDYPMIDGMLAAEFSAAITGVRSPAEALRRAQAEVDHLMRGTE